MNREFSTYQTRNHKKWHKIVLEDGKLKLCGIAENGIKSVLFILGAAFSQFWSKPTTCWWLGSAFCNCLGEMQKTFQCDWNMDSLLVFRLKSALSWAHEGHPAKAVGSSQKSNLSKTTVCCKLITEMSFNLDTYPGNVDTIWKSYGFINTWWHPYVMLQTLWSIWCNKSLLSIVLLFFRRLLANIVFSRLNSSWCVKNTFFTRPIYLGRNSLFFA